MIVLLPAAGCDGEPGVSAGRASNCARHRALVKGGRTLWVGVDGADLDAQLGCLRLMGEEILPRFVA